MKTKVGLTLLMSTLALSSYGKTIVAVIDSGINVNETNSKYLCTSGHRYFNGYSIRDNHGHGTNIVSIIGPKLQSDQCIVVIKAWEVNTTANKSTIAYSQAVDYALKIGASYVNYSGGGPEPEPFERASLMKLLQSGAKIAVAAGNEKNKQMKYNCNYFPACYDFKYPNFYVVSTYREFSNDNFKFDIQHDKPCGGTPHLCGTSQATAFFMSKLINRNPILSNRTGGRNE